MDISFMPLAEPLIATTFALLLQHEASWLEAGAAV
jgi:hypothetical protein